VRGVSDESYRKKTRILWHTFFLENHAVYEVIAKYTAEPFRPYNNTAQKYIHLAYRVMKVKAET
jgi:hypothetical protein